MWMGLLMCGSVHTKLMTKQKMLLCSTAAAAECVRGCEATIYHRKAPILQIRHVM